MGYALKKTTTIEPPELTPEDWQLFTFSGYRPASAKAAQIFNEKFAVFVNNGNSAESVYTQMRTVMRDYRETGAMDTEPRGVLKDLIDEVFGPNWEE